MDELDGSLRRATGERLSYDERRGELVLRSSTPGARESRLTVGKEALRNALQSVLLAADPPPAVVDDALAAGAQALVAAYDVDPAGVERLVRRTEDQFAAARRRRRG